MEFVKGTVCTLNPRALGRLKEMLVGDFLSFSVVNKDRISVDLMAEKLCDYFTIQEIKNNCSFISSWQFFFVICNPDFYFKYDFLINIFR